MKLSRFLVALGLSIALPLTQSSSAHAQTSEPRGGDTLTEAGQLAPDFRMTLLDGTSITLGSMRGKTVILNLFATWCPSCRSELPYLEWLNKRHKGPNFAMVSVARDQPHSEVAPFWKQNGFSFPAALDPGRRSFALYANASIPRTYLISPSGHILYQTVGYRESDFPYIDGLISRIEKSSQGKRAFAWRKQNEKTLNSFVRKPGTTAIGEDGKPAKPRSKAVYLMDERGQWRLN